MSNQGLLTICSIFGFHSGVNAMINVCFSYLSRCLYKASAGDVCCDDFLVRSETFTSLNVESKDTTCTVCWSLWLELTLRVIGILSKYPCIYNWMGVGGFPLDLSETYDIKHLYISVESSEGDAPDHIQSAPQCWAGLCVFTDWQGLSLYWCQSESVCLSVSLFVSLSLSPLFLSALSLELFLFITNAETEFKVKVNSENFVKI